MKEKEQKLQIGIYKIDTENDIFLESGDDPCSILSSELTESSKFEMQELHSNQTADFSLLLLYKTNFTNPRWKDFLRTITKGNQKVLKKQGRAESFVLLMQNSKSLNLYAITGGQGHFAIQNYIDNDFGVDVISRFINKEDRILKFVKEKSFMGGILGSARYFRSNYNLVEADSFGKIFQELQASINKDILAEHFGFTEAQQKRLLCIAKSSFKINKSIEFSKLLEIIKGCENILENLAPISINNVKKIVKKRDKELVKSLDEELLGKLWRRFDENYFIDFDLCHRDFEKYLTASNYVVSKNNCTLFELSNLTNADELFQQIKQSAYKPQGKNEFEKLVSSLKIYTYDNENIELTSGSLISHVFGDISVEDNRFFLIDNTWYQIDKSFIEELDQSCAIFIKDNFDEGLKERWNHESEDHYIDAYFGAKNTLVLHRITPDNIEPCDILRWNSDNLFLYHVKIGFGNTMRDLCSQIFIAASHLRDSKSKNRYAGRIFDELVNKLSSNEPYFQKLGKQTNNTERNEFIKLFTDKKITFVLAITDNAKEERNLKEDILKFKSNIAKFSLQELVKGMKGIDIDLKITQISRAQAPDSQAPAAIDPKAVALQK